MDIDMDKDIDMDMDMDVDTGYGHWHGHRHKHGIGHGHGHGNFSSALTAARLRVSARTVIMRYRVNIRKEKYLRKNVDFCVSKQNSYLDSRLEGVRN